MTSIEYLYEYDGYDIMQCCLSYPDNEDDSQVVRPVSKKVWIGSGDVCTWETPRDETV